MPRGGRRAQGKRRAITRIDEAGCEITWAGGERKARPQNLLKAKVPRAASPSESMRGPSDMGVYD